MICEINVVVLEERFIQEVDTTKDAIIATTHLLETVKGDEKLMLKVILRLFTQSPGL